MRWAIMFAALSALGIPLRGEERTRSDTAVTRTAADTVREHDALPAAPLRPSEADTAATASPPTKSPGLALLLSAILPGAGQAYNESYWKLPVIVGFGVWFGYEWIHNNNLTRDYRDQYQASITPGQPSGNARFLQLREFYKDQRDTYSWYLFIWYILNLVDAYVDASLYDFNVGPDLSIRIVPATNAGLRVQIRF